MSLGIRVNKSLRRVGVLERNKFKHQLRKHCKNLKLALRFFLGRLLELIVEPPPSLLRRGVVTLYLSGCVLNSFSDSEVT